MTVWFWQFALHPVAVYLSWRSNTCAFASECPLAIADQVEDQNCPRNNNQQMNELAADAAYHAQQPQNRQNTDYCPDHNSPPGSGLCPHNSLRAGRCFNPIPITIQSYTFSVCVSVLNCTRSRILIRWRLSCLNGSNTHANGSGVVFFMEMKSRSNGYIGCFAADESGIVQYTAMRGRRDVFQATAPFRLGSKLEIAAASESNVSNTVISFVITSNSFKRLLTWISFI